MKSNKWNLITAIFDVTAGVCFIFAALTQAEMFAKVLNGVAAICFLIGGAGFFGKYFKTRKASEK